MSCFYRLYTINHSLLFIEPDILEDGGVSGKPLAIHSQDDAVLPERRSRAHPHPSPESHRGKTSHPFPHLFFLGFCAFHPFSHIPGYFVYARVVRAFDFVDECGSLENFHFHVPLGFLFQIVICPILPVLRCISLVGSHAGL